jgi:NitT/TauT family transport system substrate-binding protein
MPLPLRATTMKIMIPTVFFISVLILWELCCIAFHSLAFVLPAPSLVLTTLWHHADRFIMHSQATLKEMAGGILLAFLLAFPLGWTMYALGAMRAIFQPIFVIVQCIPMFTLAPIMVLWLGWSYFSIIIPTAFMIFFPLTLNIYQGLKATPQVFIDFFRINQATKWQLFYKLQLPWSLPYFFAGLRISAGIAGIGAIAGEWAGAQQGLGVLMLESRRTADLETTFAALFCLIIISLTLYGSIVFCEKILQRKLSFNFSHLVTILLVCFCLAGCQKTERKGNEARLVLDWLPNPNHVPIYVGISKGIFAENGIDLQIQKVSDPGDALPYLLSGQAEFALTYMPHAQMIISRGEQVDIAGILISIPLNSIVYRKGEGIISPQDLNGRIVGYCTDGYDTAFLTALLKNNQIVPKELKNVSFDLVSTLGTSQVDAIYGTCWNIEGAMLRANGIDAAYLPLEAFGVPTYYELIVLSSKNYPARSASFKKALQESIAYTRNHAEEAFEIYLKANPDKSKKTVDWEKIAWQNTIEVLATDQNVNKEVWETFANWQRNNHLMP